MTENTPNPTTEAMESLTADQPQAAEADPAADVALATELAEWKDRTARLAAEMENLRKRTQKDVQDARDFAVQSFARNLLPVADNMERALNAIQQAEQTDATKTMQEGVAMVAHQLTQAFKQAKIEKFTSEGETLNPDQHQVMAQIPSDQPEGTVVQEMQAGYTLNGRLLRPALVAVSNGEPAVAESATANS